MITTARTDAGILWEKESSDIWEGLQESKDSQNEAFENLRLALKNLNACRMAIENAYNTAEGCLLDYVGSYLTDVEELYDQMKADMTKLEMERGF